MVAGGVLPRPHLRVAQELQRGQRAVHRLAPAHPAVLHADRIRGQREADRGDGCERTRREAVGRHPVDLVGRVPEELEGARSEEHTSELQSLMRISYAVFCLKKKTTKET